MSSTTHPADEWSDPKANAKQIRSKITYENLVAATTELLKQNPFDQITVVDIAKKANCSPGTVNRRFGSKEKLLDVVYERLEDRASIVLEQLVENVDFSQLTVRQLLDLFVDAYMNFVGEYRLILKAGYTRIMSNPETTERTLETRARIIDTAAQAILGSKHNIRHPDPQVAAEFATLQAATMLTDLIEGPDMTRHFSALDERTLIEQMKVSILRYLGEEE